MSDIIGLTTGVHRCNVGGCNERACIRIGHPYRRGNWFYICEPHLKVLLEEGPSFLSELPNLKKPKAIKKPDKPVAEPVIQEPAAEITETAEEPAIAEPAVELAPVPEEQEYYICKQCGERFKKPEELGLYRSHTLSAHRGDKD